VLSRKSKNVIVDVPHGHAVGMRLNTELTSLAAQRRDGFTLVLGMVRGRR
jgi:hypothetical protein